MRIRVGGSGMDVSTYVPDQTDQMLILTDPDAYFNSVPVNFGPVFFQVLNDMSDKVGSMQFIIGLSLHDIDDDALVSTRTLAAAAEDMLGDRLDALLLGNVRVLVECNQDILNLLCRNQTNMARGKVKPHTT
jgi:hypothetical protein